MRKVDDEVGFVSRGLAHPRFCFPHASINRGCPILAALHGSEPLRNRPGIEPYACPDAERRDSPSFGLFEDSYLRNIQSSR